MRPSALLQLTKSATLLLVSAFTLLAAPRAAAITVSTEAQLRSAIDALLDGSVITFGANITLTSDLPFLRNSITIDGAGHTLDGAGTCRGFLTTANSLTIENLSIVNTVARGGKGGNSAGGGGGLGAGGAIFVSSGAVTARNVTFSNNAAIGGAGGDGATDGLHGGGGGGGVTSSGLAGGAGVGANTGGNGGGPTPGLGGARETAVNTGNNTIGTAGGDLSGGGGGGGFYSGLSSSQGKAGGTGGFGGGGGGAGSGFSSAVLPGSGSGGFGGGGGGANGNFAGGIGGFGGGNGASSGVVSGAGGGGGGAGFGGAIFVRAGARFTLLGASSLSGGSVTAGAGGGGTGVPGANGLAAGSGIFLQGDGGMLTFSPEAGETQMLAGGIADQTGSGGTAANAGSGGLVKRGAGTLVLSGAHTYTGNTDVLGGTLTVNGTLAAASDTFVATGATLDGTGTIAGSVVLMEGATLGSGLTVLGTVTRAASPLVFSGSSVGETTAFGTKPDATLDRLLAIPSATVAAARCTLVRGDEAFTYVTAGNEIRVMDNRTLEIIQTLSTGTGTGPFGLAASIDGTRLYVACANVGANAVKVYTVAALTGQLTPLTTIATGAGTQPRALAIDPRGTRLYVALQSGGAVGVIDPATNVLLTTIPTGGQLVSIAISPDGSRLYVTDAASRVVVIDTATQTVVATPANDGLGLCVTVSRDGRHYYVGNANRSNITQYDAATNTPLAPAIDSAGNPAAFSVSVDGTHLYVASQSRSVDLPGFVEIFAIDPVSGALSAQGTVSFGLSQASLGLAENGNRLLGAGGTFVANTTGSLLSMGAGGPVFAGGTLVVNGPISLTRPVSIGAAGGTIDTHGYDLSLSGGVSGAGQLTKVGAGTLTLTGTNAFAGGIRLEGGTIAQGSADVLDGAAVVLSSGTTLDLAGFSGKTGSLAGDGTVSLGGATLTTGSDHTFTTFAGVLGGSGGFTKVGTGTFTIAGANTYTGPTIVRAGTLRLGSPVALGSGDVSLGEDATLDLDGFDLTLTTGSHASLLGRGLVLGRVALDLGGTIAPEGGSLTVGELVWKPGGTLALSVGGTPGSVHVTGALTKVGTGTYSVALTDLGVTRGTPYTLLTFDSQTGFTESDFTVTGVSGQLKLEANALRFTVPVLPVYGVNVTVAKGKSRAIFTITNTGDTSTGYRILPGALVTGGKKGGKPKPSKPGKKPAFKVVYTLGGADITAAVNSGTATTATIPPGGSTTVIVLLKKVKKSDAQRKVQASVLAISEAAPSVTSLATGTFKVKQGKGSP